MVDEVVAADAAQEVTQDVGTTDSNQAEQTQSQPVEKAEGNAEAAKVEVQPKQPKTYTEDELAKIVNARAKQAADKVRQDYLRQSQQVNTDPNADPMAQAARTEYQRMAQETYINSNAQDFVSKLDEAIKADPAYINVVKDLDLGQIRTDVVANVFNHIENITDVLKDLHDRNPSELDLILNAAERGHTQRAITSLRKVSDAIRRNKAASEQPIARPPLSQVPSSPATGTDNGSLDVRDYKKMSWLRG